MRQLHRHALSGHSHRPQLLLSLLGLEVELVDVDLLGGEHKAAAFRQLNPFGQVPVLVEDDGTVVADSNAILVYLAERYDDAKGFYPQDAATRGTIQRWLSVAANEVARGPAAARLVTVFGAGLDHEDAKARAKELLGIIEATLAEERWLAGTEEPSLADIAVYTYVAHAPEGEVSLADSPRIKDWLARIEALEGFVPMQATKVGLAA